MTTASFSTLSTKGQLEYLRKKAVQIHKISKGDMVVSLYWSKDFVFEVLSLKDCSKNLEIKCYDRFQYTLS